VNSLADWIYQAHGEPPDARRVTLLAAADWCDERGDGNGAYALRWMAARGKWPMTGPRSKRWAMWGDGTDTAFVAALFGHIPMDQPSDLPGSVLAAMPPQVRKRCGRCEGPDAIVLAVTSLASALASLRSDVRIP
jgi:hypothetical protein